MRNLASGLQTLLLPILLVAVSPAHAADAPGVFLIADTTPQAFGQPLPGLDAGDRERFDSGRKLFNRLWVGSVSNLPDSRPDPDLDGLGPTYNQSGCVACHLRNGRGKAPLGPSERLRGMLVRLSAVQPDGTAGPHPVYGEQLQESSITGVPAEGRTVVSWEEEVRVLGDGTRINLRRPVPGFSRLAFGEMGPALLSLRVSPQIVGAGLLDAVPDNALEALAATQRPDGISGHINRLPGGIGRFGWKANVTDLRQQTAAAFHGDLGITSTLFADENCPSAQTACAGAESAGPDLTNAQLDAVVFFQSVLAVPAPRNVDDPQVLRGRLLFEGAGCQHCHVPVLRSGADAALPILANREFAAYTDLLLHDMGPGLADHRPDGAADGQEWRTAPLWGLGLLPVVSEHRQLLHDGRARNVIEAILWHGGEAEPAVQRFSGMSAEDRAALEAFVLSR